MTVAVSQLEALKRAVTAAGSQAKFAVLCGVSQPSVWKWLNHERPLPAEHVLKVEAATGVSRHDLRPDLYPREDGSVYQKEVRGTAAPSPAGGFPSRAIEGVRP